MPYQCAAIVCVCMLKVVRKTSNEITKCCNVFVYVVSCASLCCWCCIFSWPNCFCFVLQAHVRCKCLINTPLHVLQLFCSSDLVCVASIWVVVLAACSPGKGGQLLSTCVCVCSCGNVCECRREDWQFGGGGGGLLLLWSAFACCVADRRLWSLCVRQIYEVLFSTSAAVTPPTLGWGVGINF